MVSATVGPGMAAFRGARWCWGGKKCSGKVARMIRPTREVRLWAPKELLEVWSYGWGGDAVPAILLQELQSQCRIVSSHKPHVRWRRFLCA